MTMKKTTAEKFEEYFQEWLEEIQKPEIMISSDTADYVDNEPYKKIIKLGKRSLPSIMAKIAQGYFFLNHAVSEITKLKISDIASAGMKPTSQQEISRLWLTWWRKQKQTDVPHFQASEKDFIPSWTDLLAATYRNKHTFTDKDILNLFPILALDTLEQDELTSMITKFRHNLHKPIHDFSFIGSGSNVKTYHHLIQGVALSYIIANAGLPIDKALGIGSMLSAAVFSDTKKIRKTEDKILEEIE